MLLRAPRFLGLRGFAFLSGFDNFDKGTFL